MVRYGDVIEIAGRISPFVGVGPGKSHVTGAQGVVSAQECEGALDGVSTLDPHEDRKFASGFGGEDIGGRKAKSKFVRVATDLVQDSVDEGHGAMGESTFPGDGLGPDGEELGCEVSAAGGLEIEVARVERRGDEVPGLVDETLGCVGVSVDDEGRGVYLQHLGLWGQRHRRILYLTGYILMVGAEQGAG